MAAGAARWGVWTKCLELARGWLLQLGPASLLSSLLVSADLRYWVKTGVRRIIDLTGLLPIKMWILVWSRAITREVAATSHYPEYCNQCLEHWPCIIRTAPRSEHSRNRKKLLWIRNDTANSIPRKMRLSFYCMVTQHVWRCHKFIRGHGLCPAQRGQQPAPHTILRDKEGDFTDEHFKRFSPLWCIQNKT